jgi:hypothetical protein
VPVSLDTLERIELFLLVSPLALIGMLVMWAICVPWGDR